MCYVFCTYTKKRYPCLKLYHVCAETTTHQPRILTHFLHNPFAIVFYCDTKHITRSLSNILYSYPQWAASALAGGISGAWTWAIIYPFDVIKSRIQTGPLEKHLRKSMWTVAYDLVNEHGWRYMFRGLGVTLARAFPVNAIIFPVYEFVLIQLGESDEEAVENTYVASPNPSK